MTEEQINKTREAVDFLTHIYSEDMKEVASILSHQAEGHTEASIPESCIYQGDYIATVKIEWEEKS